MKRGNKRNNNVEILVAEDSATQAEQLRQLLEARGYGVTIAANGKEALAAARKRRPTLILSDVLMPEMDGYELCRAVKSDEKLRDVPTILVTSLSDPRDVVRGLECGADNFVRKPYDEKYLLSRIESLLVNLELRKSQKMQVGVELNLGGQRHFINAERQQILDLLISTYEQAVQINGELKLREKQLEHSNQVLQGLYRIAEGLNLAASEQQVAELALERALELPGIQSGWISLREGEAGFRIAAARNLPPGLAAPGIFDGDCECRRKLLSGELGSVTNILECERLREAKGDTGGLRFHAAVPLWLGKRTLGVMNLAGPGDGLFDEAELHVLYGVGNQVAVALERARLHQHLERLVEARTAALTAEVAERKKAQEEQARLTAILEATPDFVASGDLDGRTFYVNPAGLRMIGYEPGQDLSALRVGTGHPDWALKLVRETGIPHAIQHGTWSGETAFQREDGREIPVSQVIIAHKGESGSVEQLSTIARDISERKEQERKIARLNRIHTVLSGINTTIVRVREQKELFDEACRIAVKAGQFLFAWIGLIDWKAREVERVALDGTEQGFLAVVKPRIPIGDDPQAHNLLWHTVTEKKPVIVNDVENDPRVLYKKEHLDSGIHSVVMLPLTVSGEFRGIFTLHAREVGFFDEEEMKLLIEMAGDVSFAMEHIEKEERLNYLAYYDEITGLPNRTLFLDRLGQRVRNAHTDAGAFGVVMVDLERFRNINDTLGQQSGDELLRQVGQRLRGTLEEFDFLARLSGNCFALSMRQSETDAQAAQFLDHILRCIEGEPFLVREKELRLTAKAGVALYPGDGPDAETLTRNAEAALRNAKSSGQRYLFYAPEMNARVAERLSLETRLRRALEKDEFLPYYQPIISLRDAHLSGLEALIRWQDPEEGLVLPGRFIPVLEETGLILEAGRLMLRLALQDFDRWSAAGIDAPQVSVNVSALQLRHRDFVADVKTAIEAARGGGAALKLEITESLIMEDIDRVIPKLEAIRDLGVTIVVDDFGTGYSSLSYIAKLPINALKVDRSFVESMATSPDSMSIVSTIISLAHNLNLTVVAEGVETQEQEKLLRLLRCDEAQGYLYNRPAPFDQVSELLQARHKS